MREIKLHKVIMDLKNRRDLINGQIDKIRKTCKHNGATSISGSNTGNFCELDNSYWLDWICPHCGATGTTTQGRDKAHKYGYDFTKCD